MVIGRRLPRSLRRSQFDLGIAVERVADGANGLGVRHKFHGTERISDEIAVYHAADYFQSAGQVERLLSRNGDGERGQGQIFAACNDPDRFDQAMAK